MTPQPEPTEWNSLHAKELRDFLASPAGVLAISWVMHRCPDLLDGSDVNRTLVTSGQVKGWHGAVNELFSLTREQPPEVTNAEPSLPDLDDDSKWPTTLGGTKPNPQ